MSAVGELINKALIFRSVAGLALFLAHTPSHAVVATSGCANLNVSCTLNELIAGGTIQIDDVQFANFRADFAFGDVTPNSVTVTPDDTNPLRIGLRYTGAIIGGSNQSFLDFSFSVTTSIGAALLSDASLTVTAGDALFSVDTDLSDQLDSTSPEFATLTVRDTTTGLADAAIYTPTNFLFVENFLASNPDGDQGSVSQFEQYFSLTPQTGVTTENPFPASPGFSDMTKILQAPGDASRWFVLEQRGVVRVFDVSDPANPAIYLDISSSVRSGGEQGLLGMEFHPNFPVTPEVYLSYTGVAGGSSRISRFILDDTDSPTSFTEQLLLTVDQPTGIHNGGDIAFGPDDYLYIGLGDGGGAGDPNETGQNTTNLLGSMLRVDVLGVAFPAPAYQIPADNPFAGNAKCGPTRNNANDCPEIYAWGFRNPWRWSFDAPTGQLWLSDVGQNAWEEVDNIEPGGNYGWDCREGANDFELAGCPASGLIEPVSEYAHTDGNASITGGYLYRGSSIPELTGRYVFADYVSGRIWALQGDGQGGYTNDELIVTPWSIAAFALGEDGELYFADRTLNVIGRLVPGGANAAPVLAPIGLQTVNAGDTQAITIRALDVDAAPTTLDFTADSLPTLPTGSISFTDNGDGTATLNVSPAAGDAGDYPVTVTVTDNGNPVLADAETFTLRVLAPAANSGAFIQDAAGLLSIEAEHLKDNVAAGGAAAWAVIGPVAPGASNEQAIKAAGGSGTTTPGAGSYTNYEAQLEAGQQYVWARFRAFSGGSDSFFFQFANGAIQRRSLAPVDGQWHWVELKDPITVPTADIYTLTIYRRERDVELDKLVVTTNPSFDPETENDGAGPDESLRVGGGGNTAPVLAPIGLQTVNEGIPQTITMQASDDNAADTLEFTADSLPTLPTGSITFTDNGDRTATLDVNAAPGDAGDYPVTVTVTDNGNPVLADPETFTLRVVDPSVNTAPVLAPIGLQTVNEGVPQTITMQATDDNAADTLEFTADSLPTLPTGSISFTDNGDRTARLDVSAAAGDAGDYPVTVTVTDDGNPVLADPETFTLRVLAPAATGAFVQDSNTGMLVAEAEHFKNNVAAGGAAAWAVIGPVAPGASNEQAIKAAGGSGTTTPGAGSYTDYEGEFSVTGAMEVWVRFRAFSDSTDSFFFQFAGGAIQRRSLAPDDGQWHWVKLKDSVTVATPGTYTFTIFRRERETEIDKVIVTPASAGYTPPANDVGPPESPRL